MHLVCVAELLGLVEDVCAQEHSHLGELEG